MQVPHVQDSTVIFMHIPKAAGSTLHSVLTRCYRRNETFNVKGARSPEVAEFAASRIEDRVRIRLVKGHLLFGFHKYLPRPSTYITILRDPVDRVISHYYYVMRRPHHRLYETVTSANMSLEEYVESGTALELNNGQVRAFYGTDHLNVEFGRCTRAMFDEATRNMRSHFSVVGTADRFDEALLLMKHRLQWNRQPFYLAKNVTKDRPSLRNVPKHVIRKIQDANELDIEFFDAARRSFDEEVERLDIARELESFRARNRLYSRCARPVDAVRTTLGQIKRSSTSMLHV